MLQNTSFQAFRLSFTIRFRKRKVLCRLVTLFAAFLLIPETAASQSSSPREKVHLHLDKSVYAAGDTIWFKAYTVLAGTNELSATSKVLHADLYASSGTRIARLLLPLRSGLSNGDIALPDTLKEGRYRLRAYTSWMRNFGDSSFFERIFNLSMAWVLPVSKPSSRHLSAGQPTFSFFLKEVIWWLAFAAGWE